MNEDFCVACGHLTLGPVVAEDHDDFLCFSCLSERYRTETILEERLMSA